MQLPLFNDIAVDGHEIIVYSEKNSLKSTFSDNGLCYQNMLVSNN